MDFDIERLKVDAAYWDEVAPKEATHYTSETDNNYAAWWIGAPNMYARVLCKVAGSESDRWTEERADDDEVAVAIPRPTTQSQEWYGTGLPPVGCECEYALKPSGPWFRCEIISHNRMVIRCPHLENDSDFGLQVVGCNVVFRPIRTPEQRLREELGDIIGKNIDFTCSVSRHIDNLNVDVGGAIDAILAKYNLTEK